MLQDPTRIQESLLGWIQSRSSSSNDELTKALLNDIVLSDNGRDDNDRGNTITLQPDNIVLDARVKLLIRNNNSSSADANATCEYTVGSIILQIRNPKQSLIHYRNDCKKYNVVDPVKAIDKSMIVQYFLPSSYLAIEVVEPTTTTTAVTNSDDGNTKASVASTTEVGTASTTKTDAAISSSSTTAPTGEKSSTSHERSERTSSSKHHRDKDRHSSSTSKSQQHRSSSSGKSHRKDATAAMEPPKKKKKPDLVTNEQLFEHLNVVVDKRSLNPSSLNTISTTTTTESNKKEEEILLAQKITKALSAQGFEINNPQEQLLPYKERTSYILSNEIQVGNSASILRANNPRKNLSRVLELYMETITPSSKLPSSSSKGGKPQPPPPSKSNLSSKSGGGSGQWRTYLVGKKPVIIVPKGMTSPITILNAYEFLCNGKYIPRAQMIQQLNQNGQSQSPHTTFTRTVPIVDSSTIGASSSTMGISSSSISSNATGLLEYEIMDNPCKLGNNPKEWERIVAVIVLGQSWQFKDWMKSPIAYNTPASLFDRVYGYYIGMEGDKIPADVPSWAVKKAHLNRDKRGMDSVTHSLFWNELDEWMKVYKAELFPQSG